MAAQGGGRVTVPGDVQETFRNCTTGHGLVGNTVDRWVVGLGHLGGLLPPLCFHDSTTIGCSINPTT